MCRRRSSVATSGVMNWKERLKNTIFKGKRIKENGLVFVTNTGNMEHEGLVHQ